MLWGCSCLEGGEEPSFGLRSVEAGKMVDRAKGRRYVHSRVIRRIVKVASHRCWRRGCFAILALTPGCCVHKTTQPGHWEYTNSRYWMIGTALGIENSGSVRSCRSSGMMAGIRGCCSRSECRRIHEVLHYYGSLDYSTCWRSSSHYKIDILAAKPAEGSLKFARTILVIGDWLQESGACGHWWSMV
jgi:hypothetical protein